MPAWLTLIQVAIQLEPALAQGIQTLVQLKQLPTMTTDQLASLQSAMNAAVAQYDKDTGNA